MQGKLFRLIPLLLFCSCSSFQETSYKTYKHPSLQFAIQYPSTWDVQEGGQFGSQVIFYSEKKNSLFRANANIVVTEADNQNIDAVMKLSVNQLKLILNQYEVITQNKTKLGTLDAFEIRGRYTAKEGNRVIRTVVGIHKNIEYIFTFSSSLDEEKNYTKIINYMIQSFGV